MFFGISGGIVASFIVYFIVFHKRYRWFYIFYKTIYRDIRAARRFLILNFYLWKYTLGGETVPSLFFKCARRHPDKIAFYFEDNTWTYSQVYRFSNRIANFFKNEGYKKGDVIALLAESRPEYVALWLGLSQIGVITALINSNLVNDPLVHSIKVSGTAAVIFGREYKNSVANVREKIPKVKLYQWSDDSLSGDLLDGARNLNDELINQNATPLLDKSIKIRDKLLYIYTSGTTGLPKAAIITNLRFMFLSMALYYMTNLKHRDIIYNPLPLYHSAGGVAGIGHCLLRGVSLVVKKKFSASNYWSDCIKYKCTVALYIGEICRYILAAHAKIEPPTNHCVKKIIGNGLRPQIWRSFTQRFRIPHVYEFYGATEGNSNLINIDNKVGAVGFVPRFAAFVYPVSLILCDETTGDPIRNKNGLCIRCKPGQAGVLVGIVKQGLAANNFSGYVDKKATEKKIIKNVFKKGDLYFNSGDILIQDEYGYYYFKDRTGDTFRWRGENVATAEIEAAISNIVNLNDAVVYGVEIPGTEGRAGMVSIVDTHKNLDLEALAMGLKNNLASYAVPIFVRVIDSAPLTGTFKLKKNDLQQEGFNIDKIKDDLYIYDNKNVSYVKLTRDKYNDILTGKVRL